MANNMEPEKLKMMVWKMIFLFNWAIFRFHLNLPGCTLGADSPRTKKKEVIYINEMNQIVETTECVQPRKTGLRKVKPY